MNFVKFIFLIASISFSGSSFALGAVSRACFVSELSDNHLASPALLLFRYLGMPIRHYELRNKNRREQQEHAILESITTDYGLVRYYLFAAARSYRMFIHPTYGTTEFRVHGQYESRWDAQQLDPAVLQDSRLSMFFHNRNVATSVRAGHPEFVEQVSFRSDEIRGKMLVEGLHWYWDPSTKTQGFLNETSATDCNLSSIGLR